MPTYDYFPFDAGLGANSTESRWRTMFQKLKSTGMVVEGTAMEVSAGSGMTVTVVLGKAFIKGHFFSHTGTNETLAIGSNTSGSTRTDLVVIRCDFVNNTMGYLVLQGTTHPSKMRTNGTYRFVTLQFRIMLPPLRVLPLQIDVYSLVISASFQVFESIVQLPRP
jgi:hypothetical protein